MRLERALPAGQHRFVQEAEYRKLAAVEDRMWYFAGLHALVADALARHLPAGPARLLDAGCGAGGLIRRLSAQRPQWSWTGVDFSPLACLLARERTSAEIAQASLDRLPFPDGHFDGAVCADVLYHLEDDTAALRELRRVLRPGAVLAVNAPAYGWLWSYHDVAVEGRRRYTRSALTAKLRATGWRPVSATYWNTLLFPLIVFRRKLLPPPKAGSDVHEYSGLAESAGRVVLALERRWLKVSSLPFGTSIFATCLS
jgi:ubiquinone/menaquinone biosynthesis C-methylase UbiE